MTGEVGTTGGTGQDRAADERPVRVLDCLGRPCPVPVIEMARALLTVEVGQVVEVVSDDPAARLDIPAFCRLRGHDYLGERPRPGGTGLRVRRAADRPREDACS